MARRPWLLLALVLVLAKSPKTFCQEDSQHHQNQQQQHQHRAQKQQDQQQQQQQQQHNRSQQHQQHKHQRPLWSGHCKRFASFEPGIWEDLMFWQEEGITDDLMGSAISALSIAGGTARRVGLSVAIVQGKLYLPRRSKLDMALPWYADNLVVWVSALQRLVERWGPSVPDVEILLAADDDPTQDVSLPDAWKYGPPWPVMRHCKSSQSADIPIPTWHFYSMNATANFFSQTHRFSEQHPWDTKSHTAYGGGLLYHRSMALTENKKQLEGSVEPNKPLMLREKFKEFLDKEVKDPHIVFDAGRPLMDWGGFKMVMNIDGITCSSKIWQLLSLGSLVLREQSNYASFYDKQLQSFVHYVPFWRRRPREVVWAYDWVTRNDEAARRIAARGQAWVRETLTAEALECYWLQLLLQYSRLLRYTPGTAGARRIPGGLGPAGGSPPAAAAAAVAAAPGKRAARSLLRGGGEGVDDLDEPDGSRDALLRRSDGLGERFDAASGATSATATSPSTSSSGSSTASTGGGGGGTGGASRSGSERSASRSTSSGGGSGGGGGRGGGDARRRLRAAPDDDGDGSSFYIPVDAWIAAQEGAHNWAPGWVVGRAAALELLPHMSMHEAAATAAAELAAAADGFERGKQQP